MSQLYEVFANPFFAYASIGIFALSALLFLRFRKQLSLRIHTILLLAVAAVMGLAPVINLFFTFIVHNECDRLGYLFSIFFAHAIALLGFSLLPFGLAIVILYLGLNFHFLEKNISAWKNSGRIAGSLLSTYRWQTAPEVVILNLPDNFQGAYMFRSFDAQSEFAEALHVRGVVTGPVTETLKYNMIGTSDSVVVEKLSPEDLKVTFAQWGNWWWRNGKGADNYSTLDYNISIDEWSHSYTIHFRKKTPGAVYLYQCSDHWYVVKDF